MGLKRKVVMEEGGKEGMKGGRVIWSMVKSMCVIGEWIVGWVYRGEWREVVEMEEKMVIEGVKKVIEEGEENK